MYKSTIQGTIVPSILGTLTSFDILFEETITGLSLSKSITIDERLGLT